MKKIFFIFIFSLGLIISTFAQLRVASNGYVGIGTTVPAYKLDVVGGNIRFNSTVKFDNWTDVNIDWTGDCCGAPVLYPELDWYFQIGKPASKVGKIFLYDLYYSNLYSTSDDSLKENAKELTNSLDKILKIKPKSYSFRNSFINNIPDSSKKNYTKKQYGFMAREIEKIIPELVDVNQETKIYSMNYIGLIPFLVSAIKELNEIIQLQSIEIDKVNNLISENVQIQKSLNKSFNFIIEPNPIRNIMTVKLPVLTSISGVYIVVTDLNGNLKKKIELLNNNLFEVSIDCSDIDDGIVVVSIIKDSEVLSFKKVLVSKK